MKIRPYRSSDRKAILALIIELQDYERRIEADRAPGARVARPYFRYLMKRRSGIFVAEVNDAVVGFISVYIVDEPEAVLTMKSRAAYVSDIAVLRRFRQRGIGRALLERAFRFAASRGADAILVNSLVRNKVASAAYRAFGFRPYEITFRRLTRV